MAVTGVNPVTSVLSLRAGWPAFAVSSSKPVFAMQSRTWPRRLVPVGPEGFEPPT